MTQPSPPSGKWVKFAWTHCATPECTKRARQRNDGAPSLCQGCKKQLREEGQRGDVAHGLTPEETP